VALSAILTAAVRLPEAVGVKVTDIEQLLLVASEAPHVVVSAKSPVLLPVKVMLEMFKVRLPRFVRVTDWDALLPGMTTLPKVKLLAERLATAAVPVPARLTDWGLPGALSVKVTAAVSPPPLGSEGVKVTLNVQVLPADTELPQVLLVREKSALLVPVTAMLVKVKVAFPVLVKVKL